MELLEILFRMKITVWGKPLYFTPEVFLPITTLGRFC